MKNISIILALALILGVAGFFGTVVIVHRSQMAAEDQLERQEDATPPKDNMETLRRDEVRSGRALDAMKRRQGDAIIGGGTGVAVGALVGVLISMKKDRKGK